MTLSIITINWNNAAGLEKTISSVAAQTCKEFEYVIVDGASTDGSVDVIKNHESEIAHLQWVSEPDKGIYNAMNNGIRMASGDYIQILNSGDILANPNVVEMMYKTLEAKAYPEIMYGNMIKDSVNGKKIRDKGFAGRKPTMIDFFHSTLNHDPAYIKRSLFEKFGYYREDLPITADWRWYVEAIPFGGVEPVYVDIDVTIFDMTGVSETQLAKREQERDEELQRILPLGVYQDYKNYHFPMEQWRRIKRDGVVYKLFYFAERVIFKCEKRSDKRKNQQINR